MKEMLGDKKFSSQSQSVLSRNKYSPTQRGATSVMDQYNSRAAMAPVGEIDPLTAISVNYEDHSISRKNKM